jgi:leader peptidase (prepilin peptidase)/N-methyltransferase
MGWAMLQSWLTLASCLVGCVIGSFVALVADRWPRGEDIVLAPSRCRACGQRLRLAHLVPVLSYCRQGGRCVWCRAALPGVAGLAWAGLARLRGRPAGGIVPIPLGTALAASAWFWLAFAPQNGTF